jgi:signal transduction histidine kinase
VEPSTSDLSPCAFYAPLPGRPVLQPTDRAEEPKFFKILDDVYQTGIPHIGKELPFPRQLENGEITQLYLDIGYHPFRGNDGRIKGILALVHDVTEKVHARQRVEESEAALRESFSTLQEERALRERFVSTLAHDLRTPLTAVRMSSQLLLRNADDPARLQKLAGRIADNIDRADEMIRDLLDANRLKAGEKLPLEVGPCCLNEVARQTLEELSSIHGDRFVLQASSTIEGIWSSSGIRRILENLCGNGVKYGAPRRSVTVSLAAEAGQVEIQVHNEGMPIPAVELPHLFEPFRRSTTARASGERGWGLGLTLVKGIAEAHGGTVSVQSSEAQGPSSR